MPRWKEDVKEFRIRVSGDEMKGAKINIPKPIMDMWKRPNFVKFVITKGEKVYIEPA